MKWPLLDVPGTAALKDSRSPTPGHLVSLSHTHTHAHMQRPKKVCRHFCMLLHQMEKSKT